MSIPLHVLIVDDSETHAAALVAELRRSGYNLIYERVGSAAAMQRSLQQDWDVVIADAISKTASGEREANLLALIENTPDAIWSIDTKYQLITFNSSFKVFCLLAFGINPCSGMNLVSQIPIGLRNAWISYYNRALQSERFTIQQRFKPTDRSAVFEVSFNPICTQDGSITGVAVFSKDITAQQVALREHQQHETDLHQAKDQLQAVLDAVPGCVSWFSSDMTYLGINRYLAATFNLRPEDFIGKKLDFLESSGGFGEFVYDFFASDLKESSVEVVTKVDGSPRSYLMVAQKYYQDQAAVFIGIDITDRKQVEEALRESQERYALSVRGANDGLWDWNLRTDEVYFSPRWKTMLGCEEFEIGNSLEEWFDRVHADDIDRLKAQINLYVRGQTLHFESEYRLLHQDCSYRWMLSRGVAVRTLEGSATRMAGSQTDITERKRVEEQLLHDALHDALTGLPNRALLTERLGRAIAHFRWNNYLFAVLFLDVDRFKVVNDSLGHMLGDELLREFARILGPYIRVGDTLARLGGDEFVILMEQVQDINQVTGMVDCIHQVLQSPFNLQGHEVFVTVSIGVALSKPGSDRPEDLLRDADIAMYRAKALGRACHAIFDTEMHAHAVELLQLQTDLRKAVDRQEFRLHYQPIVALATNKIVGFEALVRWQHPERGLVSPSEFIAIAEEMGLIVPMGIWILHEACHQLCRWQQHFPADPPLTMSVNLSAKQFSQPDLVEAVAQILQETKLQPNCLKLEITESVVMEDAEAAIALLQELKTLGISLQIDDFGTGYSSFSYLHRFPTDTLKIDQSFVQRMGDEDDSTEIVRAIITLAHNLGMSVTAEGIETWEQFTQLQAMQSEYGQGYLFSRPVESDQAERLIVVKSP